MRVVTRMAGHIVVLMIVAFSVACSRKEKSAGTEKPEPFTFTVALRPLPLKDAEKRYSDFAYHYRLKGTGSYAAVGSQYVVPTDDSGVEAGFRVTMSERPVSDAVYETFISYRLDGKEIVDPVRETVMIKSE